MQRLLALLLSFALSLSFVAPAQAAPAKAAADKAPSKTAKKGKHPMVKLTTNFGAITLELDAEKAPITVANFLRYVDAHRFACAEQLECARIERSTLK